MTAPLFENVQSSDVLQGIQWSLVLICFLIAILSQLASGALAGQVKLNWTQVLMRLFAVILFLMSASSIQGKIWGMGESIGDSLLPGPSLVEINETLRKRVSTKKTENDEDQKSDEDKDIGEVLGDLTEPQFWKNTITYGILSGLEAIALTVFYLSYSWMKSVQGALMALLAAMAPLLIPASIIPGVNSWSNWLKLVISVSLWPVIAGFLIKSHFLMVGDAIATGAGVPIGGADSLINFNALEILAQAVIYGFLIFATPFLSVSLVYGSAGAFATGGGILMSAAGAKGLLMGSGGVYGMGHGMIARAGLVAAPLLSKATQGVRQMARPVAQAFRSESSPTPPSARYTPRRPS